MQGHLEALEDEREDEFHDEPYDQEEEENLLQLRVLKRLDPSITSFFPEVTCSFCAAYELNDDGGDKKLVQMNINGPLYLVKCKKGEYKLILLNTKQLGQLVETLYP